MPLLYIKQMHDKPLYFPRPNGLRDRWVG